jgi:hypothetical protein
MGQIDAITDTSHHVAAAVDGQWSEKAAWHNWARTTVFPSGSSGQQLTSQDCCLWRRSATTIMSKVCLAAKNFGGMGHRKQNFLGLDGGTSLRGERKKRYTFGVYATSFTIREQPH